MWGSLTKGEMLPHKQKNMITRAKILETSAEKCDNLVEASQLKVTMEWGMVGDDDINAQVKLKLDL